MVVIKYTKLYDPGAYGLVSILLTRSEQTDDGIPQYTQSKDGRIKTKQEAHESHRLPESLWTILNDFSL
jgi:hypothetical protein